MSIPIPPSPPPTTPAPNPFFGSGASLLQPVVDTTSSVASTLPPPATDASNPQLSIAQFYGSISIANIGQKLQEFISQMTDPAFRKKLMEFAMEQASYMSDVITLVYRYDMLANQLKNLDLTGKANNINSKLAAFAAGGGATADNAAITTLNTAITTYNTARTTYEAALASYQPALDNYKLAQNTYNLALQIWKNALTSYQAGTISQAELETARASFETAESQFEDVDKVAFNTAQTTFNTAQTDFQAAVTSFNSAIATYNTYVASRSSAYNDINSAINAWNTAIGGAASILTKMNEIRQILGLSSFSSTGAISPISSLSPYSFPSGPNALHDAVQTKINQNNTQINTLNSIITSIGTLVTAINAGGYIPVLTSPVTASLISSILTTNSGTAASTVPLISVPTSIVIQVPPNDDLITDYLLPRLSILEALKINNEKENTFRVDVTDVKAKNPLSGQHVLGGVLGSSNLGVSNAVGISASPFLGAILSKHAFESFFNVFGVPLGSSLVDQIGALYQRITTNLGLLSAGPAQEILKNAALTEANGKKAIETAVSLGYLSLIHALLNSPELRLAVSQIIAKEPSLTKLTPEQKNALIDSIVSELGASLIKAALNDLGKIMDLPGLMPQILASTDNINPSLSEQLFRNVIFSNELAKTFQLSSPEIDSILEKALTNAKQPDTSLFKQEAIDKFVTQELEKQNQVGIDVGKQVQQAALAADERVKSEGVKAETIKKQVFRENLLKGLAVLEFDPVKADLIASQIPIRSLEEVKTILVDKGLTLPEANQLAKRALNAANQKDGAVNPLSNFLMTQMGTTTELAGLFKAQVINILSPAVGMRQALQVAEDYGSLIFTKSNSLTTLLHVNERRLDAISYFIYDARIYEDYREATKSYISPQLANDSPLKLGITLLLSGMAGGLSNQGLTSQDNTFGPSASQSKHATSYPGIFG